MVWSNGDCNHVIREFAHPALYPGIGDTTLEQRIQEEAGVVLTEIANTNGDPINLITNGDPINLMSVFNRAIYNINYSIVFGSRYYILFL